MKILTSQVAETRSQLAQAKAVAAEASKLPLQLKKQAQALAAEVKRCEQDAAKARQTLKAAEQEPEPENTDDADAQKREELRFAIEAAEAAVTLAKTKRDKAAADVAELEPKLAAAKAELAALVDNMENNAEVKARQEEMRTAGALAHACFL